MRIQLRGRAVGAQVVTPTGPPLRSGPTLSAAGRTAQPKWHIIAASHNRRELTVRAVTRIAEAAKIAGLSFDFTLFDDGSTDGTREAIQALAAPVQILNGDGTAFWAKSMALAEAHVLSAAGEDDVIVWLNDDVALDDDALAMALTAAVAHPDAVLIGATRDPDTGQLSYSGMRSRGRHPLRMSLVVPTGELQSVDTFNGNFVVIPVPVARRIGGIDGGFPHASADMDYGFRARRAGVSMFLLPATVGACRYNAPLPPGKILADWRAFRSRKGGGNFANLRRILAKERPFTWPAIVVWSYTGWWARRLYAWMRPGETGFLGR